MKKFNMNCAKKSLTRIMTAAVAVMMLSGCGSNAKATADEGSIKPPFQADIEMYDSVISGLKDNQYYAFADAGRDYDVLLVTDGVYEYDENTMGAIDATVYGLDPDGKVVELGTVFSDGTAYPISVYDGCLMYGGNHHMAMTFVKDGNFITKKHAEEVFDENGNATYGYFDYDEHFEGEVFNNSKLMEMYDNFGKATVINFNKAR